MSPPTIRLLVPGTTQRWFCGGLLTVLRLAEVLGEIRKTEVITYRDREPGRRFVDDLPHDDGLHIVAWGTDVSDQLTMLGDRRAMLWSNSFGWGHRVPPSIPVLAASRFTMGLWGEDAPGSPIFYLPNPVMPEFHPDGPERDIDVIHVGRKSSRYVVEQLIPKLKERFVVEDVQGYVDDLAGLFRRSKVYLYDSRDYWAVRGVSEGFGLQPLEAMACGCTVFSSVNAGLSDFIDPGITAEKLGCYSASADIARIDARLRAPLVVDPKVIHHYRPEAIRDRWLHIEPQLLEHFAAVRAGAPTVDYDVRTARQYEWVRPPRWLRSARRARARSESLSSRVLRR